MIWLARTLLLILAGLATLSIIGAITAIPGNPTGLPGSPRTVLADTPAPPRGRPDVADPRPAPGRDDSVGDSDAPAPVPASASPEPPRDPALAWLEPLTYAVIALAGFAAAMLIALLRIGSALTRRFD